MKTPHALLALLMIVPLQRPAPAFQELLVHNGLRLINGNQQEANFQQVVQQTLDASRDAAQTPAAWRDTIEDRLVAIGPGALPFLKLQLPQRNGDLLDALQVAIFRLENPPLNPREAITAFAARALPHAPGTTADLKISRVRWSDVHRDLFPHHLFYTLDTATPPSHSILALAADGKVQSLPDDAALLKFMRAEAEPAETELLRERACSAAATLLLARTAPINKSPDLRPTTDPHSAEVTLQAAGRPHSLKLTFDDAGKIATLTSTPL